MKSRTVIPSGEREPAATAIIICTGTDKEQLAKALKETCKKENRRRRHRGDPLIVYTIQT